ncbi:hypothetical protein [Streptomyces noursei]|uniref:hypothetical protein n=1 Tax=Streptomyces noursei TaxID=1971 RepID=UPI001671BA70|nr:hypothetical protein [Streptomyces noursei]MCZ1013990.1 hypothetical protein [Streptomyces noursei]
MDDVKQLVKQWVKKARADAKANGEFPPPPFSRVPQSEYEPLFREAHYWHQLACGEFLDEITDPRPSAEHITAMRQHLADCTENLHTMMNARGNNLPDGTREQLAVIEQRIGMALDIVEHAGHTWGREADHAWQELMTWAQRLHYGHTRSTPRPWDPEYTPTRLWE